MVEGSGETPTPVERVSGRTPSGRLPLGPAPAVRGRHHHRLLGAVVFTVLLLGLMALAVEAVAGQLAFVLLGSVVALIAAFHRLFPGAEFFTVALANFIGLYSAIFILFLEANFKSVGALTQAFGFLLPLVAFLGGAAWRRRSIRTLVRSDRLRMRGQAPHGLLWLIPVFAIGGLTFTASPNVEGGLTSAGIFIVAMAAISGVVLFASRNIAIFLLETGLIFEGFFKQAARLVVPAFAFFTFYTLEIIVFAAIYTIMDRVGGDPIFLIDGVRRHITFPESLYFSLVTLSSVGYGDILPKSGLLRFVVAVQIIFGVLLLLFGFSAIIDHNRDRRDTDRL